MIDIRATGQLASSDFGKLKALHHIAVGSGRDNPLHQPIGDLIVWNDDELAAGASVSLHPHASTEIITYVREGRVNHRDSLGNGGTLNPGDVQVMSAGHGIRHAEMSDRATRIFQIWIKPRTVGGAPEFHAKSFGQGQTAGRFEVLASGYPEDAQALPLQADARLLRAALSAGETLRYPLGTQRTAYLVVGTGSVTLNNVCLHERDGAAVREEEELHVTSGAQAEIFMVVLG